MGANKANVYPTNGKLDDYNQTIPVIMNIKDITQIAHHVRVTIVLANVTEIVPLPLGGNIVPSFKWHLSICIFRLLIEEFQFLMRLKFPTLKQ